MGILTISFNHKVGWAVYRKDKLKKITSGQYTFQEIEGESGKEMFNRFTKYINELLYSHEKIKEMFCMDDTFVDGDLYKDGVVCLEKIAEENNICLNHLDLNSILLKTWNLQNHEETKIITNVKTLGHKPDSINEAYAISAVYYINSN